MKEQYYDRETAVKYANKWWNKRNLQYPIFEVDCTNYVSQCLHAGGFKMHGFPNVSVGWWCEQGEWSYSWSVAHSLYWYFKGLAQSNLVTEKDLATDLEIGDIICYDFAADQVFDHTTIVTKIGDNGMPYVNAHTDDSFERLWTYRDSMAWTPQINYAFFHILD